ncbi:MAG TPA: PRC-barrel domain-containing protein [Verrucomicrobiae bacterium]|nr:PRC-barrel domain-containing protein [Verrucomicrobiae bacterium]
MNKSILLTVLATAAVSMSLAQAQEEQVSHDNRLGRAVPATAIINRDVVTQGGKEVGKIDDAIFDMESGRLLYVALDLKGAGVNDTVAVPPALFTYGLGRAAMLEKQNKEKDAKGISAKGNRHPFVIRTTEEALKGAPKYAKTGEERAQGAYVDKVYAHFNQPRWWQGAGDSAAGKFNHIRRATQVKTFTVQNVSNEKLGQVETVLFDLPSGRVSFVVLDPANRIAGKQMLIPVPPMAFTSGEQKSTVLTLDADKDKLNNAPSINRDELNADDIQRLSTPAFATQVYQYYGKQPWFQNENIPTPTGPDRQQKNQ